MNAINEYDLQFGLLALRMFYVTGEQLVAAINEWEDHDSQELADVLIERGSLSSDEKQLVESMLPARNEVSVLARRGDSPNAVVLAEENAGTNRATERQPEGARPSRDFSDESTLGASAGDSDRLPNLRVLVEEGERFVRLRSHAKGALGEVFLARDVSLRREVAVKEILDGYADSPENRARFVFEAEVTGTLEHPGIVPIYALGQSDEGKPYYAMRFIEGTSMEGAIEQFHASGGFSNPRYHLLLRDLLGQVIDICNTLGFAHSRGIIHRDLKPANVMLGKYGETLVVDWGLAKHIDKERDNTSVDQVSDNGPSEHSETDFEQTRLGEAIGTPQYMSPEQARGEHDQVDARSDIFSLGATIYKLLVGRPAYSGKTLAEVLTAVKRGDFPPPRSLVPSIPKPLEAICLKAMSLETDARYQAATDLGKDIANWMADEPVQAFPEPLSVRCRRWMRQHKSIVGSAALAGVSIMLVLGASVILLTKAYRTAERNRKQARAAVDQYFTVVSEDTLLNQPGMENLRTELLNQALVYYRGFLNDEQSNGLQREIALTKYFVGQIAEKNVDSLAEATSLYMEAKGMQQRLIVETPDNETLQSELANSLNALGRSFDRQQSPELAVENFKAALQIRQQLAQSNPESSEYQRKLANAVMNIGLVLEAQGQLSEAEQAIQRAQRIREEAGSGSTLEMERDLAKGYYALATLNLQQDDLEAATDLLGQATELAKRLVRQNPEGLADAARLGAFQQFLGDLQFEIGGFAAAQPYYEDSADAYESLLYQIPGVSEYQFRLANICVSIGEAFRDDVEFNPALLDDQPDAIEDAVKAVARAETILRRLQQYYGSDEADGKYNRSRSATMAEQRAGFADSLDRAMQISSELNAIRQKMDQSTTDISDAQGQPVDQ